MLHKSDIEEIHVKFIISGYECLPNEITKQVGVSPTKVWVKGKPRLVLKNGKKIISKYNSWIIESELPTDEDPDAHLENILEKIRPHKKKFVELTHKYPSGFFFGIYFNYCNPGININKKILKEVYELGSELDFDMYYLGEKLKLETPHDRSKLEKQLKQLDFISQYTNKNHDEAKTIAESLSEIEDACERLAGLVIPDLVGWDDYSEEDWKNRLVKTTNDLKRIKKAINKSKYLHKNIEAS